MRNLAEYQGYKIYLRDALAALSSTTRGVRTRLAEALACQPGYVTQVLDGDADLSPDQASLAANFLGLTEEDADHFLLLVMVARAATPTLRAQLAKQIRARRARYLDLKNRLKAPRIEPADETVFFAHWEYVAILSLVAIPGFQTREAIAARLVLPTHVVSARLAVLEGMRLVVRKGSKYVHGPGRTHLGKDSPMITRHHQNWRLRAMQAVERAVEENFHYSGVITLSAAHREVLKDQLIKFMQNVAREIETSSSEVLCGLCIDFFEV